MSKARVVFSVVLCTAFILIGCSRPYKKPLVIPELAEFKGVETLLKESKAISLITIHGMCHHNIKWLEESRDRFAESLKMDGAGVPFVPVYDGGSFAVKAYRADLLRGDEMVRVYGIMYSDVTLPAKKRELCRDVSQKTDVCPESELTYERRRASLNEQLKNELMNNCLADAAAYLGPSGQKIRSGVRAALEGIFSDARRNSHLKNAPVVFLSESLGSKVLGDALLCEDDENLDVIMFDLSRISNVFLGANQIPLLNLGFKEEACDVQPVYRKLKSRSVPQEHLQQRNSGLAGFLDLIETARSMRKSRRSVQDKVTESFSVVAFTDPNDLLTYEVSEQDVGNRDVINVIVSNDMTIFGFLENPLNAHTGYRQNATVIDFLKCGRSSDGKLACP